MATTHFLGGKVTKQTLPLVQPPSRPEDPRLKRLLLPQGELAQFQDGNIPARYMAYIELRPGHARGNHFHKTKQEYVYVISGELVLEVQAIESLEKASIPLRAGDLAFISVAIAHALRPLVLGQAIEFSEAVFDPADIHRWPLV